ncbi:MAG TPA: SpoIVB peptidase [Thermoclostridium caenicola]|uniref:SpoIVB peptidase n=1 Tax=Thermoclostridium caenicola TaxID=659425 RepID=UPI002CCDE061|nr:SpoIVB peptidase [Thermoclostridium caenicola]HOK42547.1 SpoIVB peptidase [Thermoclostridium caenicola]HOL84420.1 SpoIVB peptidase [Thermoclostridium caenicola]HPO76586.1 SpoIVB peptidase [Thermoclostridium caenicola]HPU21923.1 SpoIVB peptidase [Thermoclostridium caenicola]
MKRDYRRSVILLLKRKWFLLSFFILSLMVAVAYVVTLFVLPGHITLLAGEDYTISIRSPLFLQAFTDSSLLKLTYMDDQAVDAFERPYKLTCTGEGRAEMEVKMLGFIPVKTIEVKAIPSQQVLVCGFPVGIKLKTSGVMIINVSSVVLENGEKVSPAEEAGLLAGDIIVGAGGKNIQSIKDLVSVIENSNGKPIPITYVRRNVKYHTSVKPFKSAEDTQYRIGIWVRDSSAGIGTLTFIDPESKVYGALGHGISDIDTGSLLQVGSGQLMRSNIKGVKKGIKGTPGELEGDFLSKNQVIGDIELNCDFGVYGRLADDFHDPKGRPISIGSHSLVHVGKASILACIRDDIVEEFEIEIQKIAKWDLGSTKNMVIRITDKRLLQATGGIVQGMSGSPILQDGRLIGAVTHVFINDPERGYGVFIESMLQQAKAVAGRYRGMPKASGF